MPAFELLNDEELDALVDYVKYLSIRGHFEKYLMNEVPGLDALLFCRPISKANGLTQCLVRP